MKHTPGPWKYRLKNAGNGFIVESPDYPHSEGSGILCDVFMTNEPSIAEDRARLIAAAPELLDACQAALITLNINRRYVTCEPLEAKLRAAIDKATQKGHP